MVAGRLPRGGALTLNCIGGVGMLGLSVGMVFLDNIQDKRVATELALGQSGFVLKWNGRAVLFDPYLSACAREGS